MARQRTLFDQWHEDDLAKKKGIVPRDPNVDSRDTGRLSGQNIAILARLERGPAYNDELAAIALKYTSRISDLRAAGHKVTCKRVGGGRTMYRLEQSS